MGFFQDLKEDLSQAVTEMLPEDEKSVKEQEVEEAPAESEEFVNSEVEKEAEEQPEMLTDAIEEEAFAEVNTIEVEEPLIESRKETYKSKGRGESVMSDMTEEVLDETAVITAGMTVNGDIKSQGSLDVVGSIIGDISILGKLNISGMIQGNSAAAEIYADSAKITGEIKSTGSIKVGQSSVVIGNVFATSAVIAGAIKGDIDVNGPVILDSSAIVMGNIKSKSVQINNGAVIEGMCSQCYAEVNPTAFFDGLKK